jgi:hypothetical protein
MYVALVFLSMAHSTNGLPDLIAAFALPPMKRPTLEGRPLRSPSVLHSYVR